MADRQGSGAVKTAELEAREGRLAEHELQVAFEEAGLRQRERQIDSHFAALTERESGLIERERQVLTLAASHGAATELGGRRADAQSGLSGLDRSATLDLGRMAIIAAREELLERRREHSLARAAAVAQRENAAIHAEERLEQREKRVLQVATELEQRIGTPVAPRSTRAGAAPPPRPTPSPYFQDDTARGLDAVSVNAAIQAHQGRSPAPPQEPLALTASEACASQPRSSGTPHMRPAERPGSIEPTAPAGTAGAPRVGEARPWRRPEVKPPARLQVSVADPNAAASTGAEPRHAPTETMTPVDVAGLDADLLPASAPRRRARTTAAPALTDPPAPRPGGEATGQRHAAPTPHPDVPDDLPDAPPLPRRTPRFPTSPFLAVLTLEDQTILRQQLELDRAGRTVLVSFPGVAPAISEAPAFVYRAREGNEARFPVELRRVMPEAPRGSVVVLSAERWTAAELEAFERALMTLL